jgi:hypothetical protein
LGVAPVVSFRAIGPSACDGILRTNEKLLVTHVRELRLIVANPLQIVSASPGKILSKKIAPKNHARY